MEDLVIILSQSRYFAVLYDSLTFMLEIKDQMSVTYFDIDAGCSFSDGPFVDLRFEKCKSRR